MTDYDEFFKEQMRTWTLTRNGPPPIYNPLMTQFEVRNNQFTPEQALLTMSRENPGLMLALYEYWILKQPARAQVPSRPKAILLDE